MLAPADGTVVRANGDARDWPAYRKGSDPGNYVIIEHAPGEYTEFRHLAADSVKLAPGARVRRGDVIGRCGNSGNAGMPHLHIGFLSSIDPITTRPMRFSDYERAGADEAWHPGTGFPVKDELLRPLPVQRRGPRQFSGRSARPERLRACATIRRAPPAARHPP